MSQSHMNAVQEWEDQVAARVQRGKTRAAAIRELVIADPELHRQYLEQYNSEHGDRRRSFSTRCAPR